MRDLEIFINPVEDFLEVFVDGVTTFQFFHSRLLVAQNAYFFELPVVVKKGCSHKVIAFGLVNLIQYTEKFQ